VDVTIRARFVCDRSRRFCKTRGKIAQDFTGNKQRENLFYLFFQGFSAVGDASLPGDGSLAVQIVLKKRFHTEITEITEIGRTILFL